MSKNLISRVWWNRYQSEEIHASTEFFLSLWNTILGMLSEMFKEPCFSLSKSTCNQTEIRSELLSDLREYLFFSWKLTSYLMLGIRLLLLKLWSYLLLKIAISERILRVRHHLSLSILLLIRILLHLRRVILVYSLANWWLNLIRLSNLTLHLLTH